ncbi:MAG: BlaI/MecI/CopY family transcriptional regulator [Rhodothermales bacterium]
MKRNSLTPLGETEMEILQHVWALGEATVSQVHDRLLRERKVAYTTVMTVMKKLAEKDFLTYRAEGNTYIYRASRTQADVQQELLGGLLEKAFGGSGLSLLHSLARQESLSEAERLEIRNLIDSMEDDDEPSA